MMKMFILKCIAAGMPDVRFATALFDGKRWQFETHPQLSHGILCMHESADGALWFGAAGGRDPERGQLGGVLRFDGRHWTHYTPPEVPHQVRSIGETSDGIIWVGGDGLRRFDGQNWTRLTEPKSLRDPTSICGTRTGELWVGTRADGAFRYDGKDWRQYGAKDGLADDRFHVGDIFEALDGTIWAPTTKGVSRFDGQVWTTFALPEDMIQTSHELRTPMNAILGFTNMVIRRAGDVLPERQKGNLEKVMVAANRLLGLINDLLDLSKIEAGRMDVVVKRFDVRTLIWSCCGEVEPLVKEGVALRCEVADEVGEAETDGDRVRHIVMNLLSNALKFTEEGEVRVTVGRRQKAVGNEGDEAEHREMLEISVADTGVGIPEEALDTIFEEFGQVKGSDPEHKGTGLGLPICKGFVELLG